MPTPAVPTRIRRSATDIVRRARFVIGPRPAGPRRHRPHGLNFLERIAIVKSGPAERAADLSRFRESISYLASGNARFRPICRMLPSIVFGKVPRWRLMTASPGLGKMGCERRLRAEASRVPHWHRVGDGCEDVIRAGSAGVTGIVPVAQALGHSTRRGEHDGG